MILYTKIIGKLRSEKNEKIDILNASITILEEELRKETISVRKALDRKAKETIESSDFDKAIGVFEKWRESIHENSNIS